MPVPPKVNPIGQPHGGMSSQIFLQLQQHSFEILLMLLVLESYDLYPHVIDDCCPWRVSFFLVVMNLSVNLHDGLCVCATEICNKECPDVFGWCQAKSRSFLDSPLRLSQTFFPPSAGWIL